MKTFLIVCLLFGSRILFAQSSSDGRVVVDNETVRVFEFESKPGKDVCGAGKHSHPAHLTVMLSDATITITTAEGKVMTKKLKAGDTFWSPAETHMVVNGGNGQAKCQLVEVKKRV
jgi:quercetin dioxygenase-like cupin family protein